ncbi:serpin-ZX-like protein [Tanacetum coccineum]
MQVDFRNKPEEVAAEVNLWAQKQASGLTKEILPHDAVNIDTRLILANAGPVRSPTLHTLKDGSDYDFYLLDGSKVKKMGSESNFLERHVPFQTVEVAQFLIQKFKISFGFKANDLLKELGLVLPFDRIEGRLSEMLEPSNDGNLFVSGVYHESFVEVNEEGTEAAAVTAVVIQRQCMMIEEKVDFVADHLFIFVIREDMSRVVLFMGQVVDPRVT